jgi:hypothetical protein
VFAYCEYYVFDCASLCIAVLPCQPAAGQGKFLRRGAAEPCCTADRLVSLTAGHDVRVLALQAFYEITSVYYSLSHEARIRVFHNCS